MKHNWTYKKLGEVATLTGGFTPKADELFSEGKYPYFKVSDMNTAGNEVVLTKTSSFVVDSKKCFPQGAIVFPKNGAAVSTNKKRILGQDSIVDLNTCAAILNSDIDIKFAYYWFYNLDFKTLVRGGALPTLDLKGLRSLQIPIPSLDEQQAIVRELDGINRLIDLQEEQLREYDRLAQSLFYTTFGDPATNPKGWEVKSLGDISEPITGITYSPGDVADDGIIVLRSSNIQDNKLDFDDIVRVRKTVAEKYYVKAGDILMCSRNGSFRLVGKTALVDNLNEKMTWGAFMTIIRSDYNPYLLQYFRTPAFREQLTTAKTTTVNQITIGMLKKLQLPIPPANLQQTFAAQIEAIEQQKALIRRSLDDTRTLLAARMQYYFE